MTSEILTIENVSIDIAQALKLLDGEIITKIYNEICPQRIIYLGDSLWIKEANK